MPCAWSVTGVVDAKSGEIRRVSREGDDPRLPNSRSAAHPVRSGGTADRSMSVLFFAAPVESVAKGFKENLMKHWPEATGMRVNGSPRGYKQKNAKELREFKGELEQLFSNERIIASCRPRAAGS